MKIVPASALLDISKDYADHRSQRENSWYGYVDGKIWGATPFAVSALYRGQTAHHLPFLPSIARGLQSTDIDMLWKSSIADQAKIVFRLAQSWWFSRELSRHPIAKHAAHQRLDLDPIALAQHYEIPTGYLDLTDDFNVSAFFATCHCTPNGWEPVESGIGVIYRVILKTLENSFGRYTPLGPQQLPRPTEQCAWVAELPLCHSFEGWPNVSMLKFHHDKRIGAHFLNLFADGELLFPPDPLADIAKEILNCREIPSNLVDAAIDSFASDPCGVQAKQVPALRKEIAKLATLVNYRKLLTDQHTSPLLSDSEWCRIMLADVKVNWKVVRRVVISQDGNNGADS